MNIKNLILFAAAVMVPVALMGASVSIGSGVYLYITIIFCGICIFLLMMLLFADFILVPLITSLTNVIVQPYPNYTVTKNQNAVIKKVGELSYATGYLTANLFTYAFKQEAVSEEEELRLSQAPENWERVVMNLGFPFKFHVISTGLDVQKQREDLEGKRSYQEFQKTKAQQSGSANQSAISEMDRNLSIIEARMSRLSAGEKPVSVTMYIETVAAATTEKAALDYLAVQMSQLQVAFSSLDLSVNRVAGRELYALMDFNFFIPIHNQDLESVFDLQG